MGYTGWSCPVQLTLQVFTAEKRGSFLGIPGMVEDELEVATDTNYKFDLCIQLAGLEVAKVNPKAAESLADAEEYPNLFEDWQVALEIESSLADKRGIYPPAKEYLNFAGNTNIDLLEAFKQMQIAEVQEETPLENGDSSHKENEGEEHEEAVEVKADDSTDSTILINGNEPD
ncbi:Coatomer subunit beta'-2 [Acorus calamus]|uniref:Coatomer subunit beta'-2 n=1 Tax=Acorus calamus TaxID=4465 RepID=A0AAV9EJ57_ACOCL|nr:Coatomer subunit beta'-2 [Acorus calamus]